MNVRALTVLVGFVLFGGSAPGQTPAQADAPPRPEPAPAARPEGDAYVAYGTYDLTKVLGTRPGADGRDQHFLDMQLIHTVFDDLLAHAANYPTNFRTDEERQRAQRDASTLANMLDIATKPDAAPIDMLLLAGRMGALAHNLDVPRAAERAAKCFERSLAREPENPQANFHFGVFLASTGARSSEAVACLEKAARLGVDAAWFSLGMLQLTLGDREHGLASLEAYTKKVPGDAQARKLLDGLRDGSLKFEARKS